MVVGGEGDRHAEPALGREGAVLTQLRQRGLQESHADGLFHRGGVAVSSVGVVCVSL